MPKCTQSFGVSGEPPESSTDSTLETVFYRHERVRLVYWESFTGASAAVALTGLLAILSFVTGLSTLSQDVVALEGPLAAVLPDVEGIVRFSGVLLAFVLGILVVGLQRRKRLAWRLTVVVLPLVGLLPLLTLEPTHVPLLVLSVATVPALALNHEQFDQRLDLSPLQIASLSSIVAVLAYGTVGSYALRDQFTEIHTWSDAFYYVVITIATVGYGDIAPETMEAKWFSLSIIVLGVGAFTTAIGALIVPAIEKRMANAFGNMTPSGLTILEDHVLVLGYSDITESVLDEIGDDREVVVVTPDTDRAAALDDRDVNVLTADPTDEESLRNASIDVASGVVVATRDDAIDVLAILAAKTANPDVRIVAAANDPRHVHKLEEVGADVVISPMAIGGRMLGRSVVDGTSPASLFDDVEDEDGDGAHGNEEVDDEDDSGADGNEDVQDEGDGSEDVDEKDEDER